MNKEFLEQMISKIEITKEDDGRTTTFEAVVKARVIVTLPTSMLETAPDEVFQLSISQQISRVLSLMFDEDIKIEPEKIPI